MYKNVFLLIVYSLLLIACASDDDNPANPGNGADPVETNLNLQNFTWSTISSIPTTRNELTAAQIDNKVYLIGGNDYHRVGLYGTTDVVEIYDVTNKSWSTGATTLTLRFSAASVVLNGNIWILGGHGAEVVTRTNEVEIYDPVADSWQTGVGMLDIRQELAAASYAGKVYAMGGTATGSSRHFTVEEFDPVSQTWRYRAPMPRARTGAVAVTVADYIYVIGGIDENAAYASQIDVFDPIANSWTTLITQLNEKRWMPAATVINGKIVVSGGEYFVSGQGTFYNNSVVAIDPVKDTLEILQTMPAPRAQHSSVTVANKVYLFGGSPEISETHVLSQ